MENKSIVGLRPMGWIFFLLLSLGAPLLASTPEEDLPFLSARGVGLSHTLGSQATGSDTVLYQPGLIGSYPPTVDFPRIGFTSNAETRGALKKLNENDMVSSKGIKTLTEKPFQGKPQYGRLSSVFGFSLGPTQFVLSSDHQFEAWRPDPKENLVEVNYRNLGMMGAGLGFQKGKDKNWGLGFFSGYQVKEEYHGVIESPQGLDPGHTLYGWYSTVGGFWTIHPNYKPTVYVTLENPAYLYPTFPRRTHLGASVLIPFDKEAGCHVVLEERNLFTNKNDTFIFKDHLYGSLEIRLGGLLPHEMLFNGGLGLSPQGSSLGFGVNFGLVELAFARENRSPSRDTFYLRINPL
jgi:hypothetical protein